MSVRVRFAPSPTGYLHIGGARTALFNWLFAKKYNGKFILRIEDTDVERSDVSYTQQILDSLKWLGISWDEGPYYQSERFKIYEKYVEQLILSGDAYPCFCRSHELRDPCRFMTTEERNELIKKGKPAAIRFKTPDNLTVSYEDLVHGKVTFNTSNIEDFVIVRSDGFPTYNFTVVIDDADLKITHVIRGNDHIPNTPKQILIYRALKLSVPKFAHIPMVLGPDGKRLSKRHGATSVAQFREKGILSSTLIFYLATLGFATKDSKIITDLHELIEKFDISRVSKTSAIFDYNKLLWLNGQLYKQLSSEQKVGYFKNIIGDRIPEKIIPYLVNAVGDRIKSAEDVLFYTEFLFKKQNFNDKIFKKIPPAKICELIPDIIKTLENSDFSSAEKLEKDLRTLSEQKNIKFVIIAQIIRFAITKKLQSFGLFELLFLNGREKTLHQLGAFLRFAQKKVL